MKQKIPMYLHSSKFLFACSEDNYFTITYHCLLNRTILHTMTEVDICQFHTRQLGSVLAFLRDKTATAFHPSWASQTPGIEHVFPLPKLFY